MLVLTMKIGEPVLIAPNVAVVATKIAGKYVSLGFVAPEQVSIVRGKVLSPEHPGSAVIAEASRQARQRTDARAGLHKEGEST
jgi:carbon storage regulator CsrA